MINVRYEFAVLDFKESTLERTIYSSFAAFHRSQVSGISEFVEINLLNKRKIAYLPRDVLTVRCRIWCSDQKSPTPVKFSLRTCVTINKLIFPWSIKKDGSTGTISKIVFSLPLETEDTGSVCFEQRFYENRKYVKVFIDGYFKKKYPWKCIFQISACEDEFLQCDGIIDPKSLPYEKDFEYVVYSQNFSEGLKSSNTSNVKIECVFSIVSRNFNYSYDAFIANNDEDGEETQIETSCTSRAEDKVQFNSIIHDINSIYRKGVLSDFTVKVQNKSFPVHSLILSMRSAVFSRMLETNMKESINKTLELDDLDESTVSHMLDYMYTDDIGEISMDNALQLYYAGDKYDLPDLKEKISSYLESNISCSNVCDILELADRHQDEHLKSTAVNFIFQHERKMMTSDEFEIFSKRNPELCVETMLHIARVKCSKQF